MPTFLTAPATASADEPAIATRCKFGTLISADGFDSIIENIEAGLASFRAVAIALAK
jgi:hypothetical protein